MSKRKKIKKYDLIFSIGEACFCSSTLRSLNLQDASYPFDWIGGCSFAERCNLIVNKFNNRFFEKDDLEYLDTAPQENNYVYINKYNNLSFNHDFPVNVPFDEAYKLSKAKYDRRLKRMYENIDKASSVLLVYMELPSDNHIEYADELLINAFNSLKNFF